MFLLLIDIYRRDSLADYKEYALEFVVKNDGVNKEFDVIKKCVYIDNKIIVLITCATDKNHGLALDYLFPFKDENGEPIMAYEKDDYILKIIVQDKKGKIIAETSKDIKIDYTESVLMARFTGDETFSYIEKWAKKE